jgi:hypothetical protein
MRSVIVSLLLTLRASLRNRAALQLEILALRHQLHVVNRSRLQRVRLTPADRLLWVWLSKRWNDWRAAVLIAVNETDCLTRYLAHYHQSRTHLSLAKDSPRPRPIAPPRLGAVVAIPQVGGLHHRYDRHAA